MAGDEDASVCENPEGAVGMLALRTLLKELVAIELPSLKVLSVQYLREWFSWCCGRMR